MPIFDYHCNACGHKDELMVPLRANSTQVCPACGKESFDKQVSAPQFFLSGSGYYETDEKPKNAQRRVVSKDCDTSGSCGACTTTEKST